jgi:hypothetical protein
MMPMFRTRQGALRALCKTGHRTLECLMDSLFPRIAPAQMLWAISGCCRERIGACARW